MMDNELWEVIENGNSFLKTHVVEGVTKEMTITTTEEKAQRRLEVKARSTLMMGILNEHQLKFNSIKNAKQLLEAVEKRFGGNAATKKQRNPLKQQFENFSASSSEMLDQTFYIIQKLVSQLELLCEKISQEDVNQKLLRSLSPEWNTHVVMWRNKDDFETMSMNDLYNNLKIYEPEVKGVSSLISSTQNMVFVSSSNNNTNGVVNTAHEVFTASTQVNDAFSSNIDNLSDVVICAFLTSQPNSHQLAHEDLEQIHQDDMEEMDLRWQMAMLTMRAKRFLKKTGRKINVNGNDFIGFDKSKVECYNCHKNRHFARECRASRNQENKNTESTRRSVPMEITNSSALVSCDGLMVMIRVIRLDEFANKPVVDNEAKSRKEKPNAVRKNNNALIIKEWVSDNVEEEVAQPKVIKNNHVLNKHELKRSKNHLVHRFYQVVSEPGARYLGSIKVLYKLLLLLVSTARISLILPIAFSTARCKRQGNPQMDLQDKGVIDSGCSRHMIRNISYLNDYEEIDRGYVAFGGNPKGGKIIRKYHLGKFDGKADEGFFVGYSLNSKAFRIFNSRAIVEENLHIRFSESIPNVVGSGPYWLFDIDALTRTVNYEPIIAGTQSNGFAGKKASNNAGQARMETEPVKDYILLPLWTADLSFSQDPKNSHDDGLKPSSDDKKKVDEDPCKGNEFNVVSKNINIKLSFDPNMPALKDIGTFNFSNEDEDDDAVADMNNLDTTIQIKEEVYVCQPPEFEDPDFPDRVYKVEKALYGLHQAPRAWFTEAKTTSTPMETQKPLLKDEDGVEVDVHMYRSMIGSLMYLTSSRPDIMFAVCTCAKYQVNPKVSHLHAVKRIFRYLKDQPKLGLWYLKDSPFDLVAYTDSDYAGASLDGKSTIGEAEYVAASSCCGQLLWIQNQLLDYGHILTTAGSKLMLLGITYYCQLNVNAARHNLQLLEHFWSTAVAKTINGEGQIHAKIDGRSKPKRKDTQVPQLSVPTESFVDEAIYKERDDRLVRAATTASSSEAEHDSGGGPRGNTLQSDKDRLKLTELMELCNSLQSRVLDLEKTKTTQALDITRLKRRVKKLEKKKRSRTHKLKRLYKVGLTARVDSSKDEQNLGEDASKQGRKITDIYADKDITLVNDQDDAELFDVNDLHEHVKLKKKEQIRTDEEATKRLQEQFDDEERLAREHAQKEQEANIAVIEEWNDI
uniref:Uncharacterized mitochondrial protein AtMg00810-like n=1 Tax=Tanacetum cinerariifolium TaxID=118510 RepID=A0A6L2J4L8_TANCI|nr:uncharacterized mitochondrial protein AtMg00810-like [Tanacetum cinerariifolium]